MGVGTAAIWTICAISIAGVLTRARGVGEWVYAVAGALLLTSLGLISPADALTAVGRGSDVYLFLAGMMILAELARRAAVFDWLAAHAVRAAHGSRWRLFALVYGVGVVVTTVLSNDATAVVLTPAVAAAVRAAKAAPLPHLLACALVANAASFVLPISNPANLVVFAREMPNLGRWLQVFALPSLLAIVITFVALGVASRQELRGELERDVPATNLAADGWLIVGGIVLTAGALVAASAARWPLGLTTFVAAALVFATAIGRDRAAAPDVVSRVSWSVLLLVAGLFVLVEGVARTGVLAALAARVATLSAWPAALAVLAAGGVTGIAANAINNLPAGLIAGMSVAGLHGHEIIRSAVAIGIDLGPNLSVTGSLATVLWLIALRREGITVSAASFLRVGLMVMPPALVLALESLVLTSR